MKILQIRAAEGGCREYRMNIPANCLRNLGHEVVQANFAPNTAVEAGQFAGYDVVICQKLQDPRFFAFIKSLPENIRPTVVYEIDDAVWDMPIHNPAYSIWKPIMGRLLECISLSDAVTCSTLRLKRNIQRVCINSSVHIIHNFLDLDTRNWERGIIDSKSHIAIGWAGGAHHYRDDEPMMEGLREAMSLRPNTVFAFMGNEDLGRIWYNNLDLPNQFDFIPGRPFEEYPEYLPLFDIGVAPLLNNEFNRCKSDLKCLEYGAWGIPVVASDIAPYMGYASEARGGCYLADTPGGWKKYLLHLIDSESERRRVGQRNKEHIWNQRGPKKCGASWEKALKKIVDKNNARKHGVC